MVLNESDLQLIICTQGMNEDGQCGTGNEINVLSPTQIDFDPRAIRSYVVDVSCGHSHTGKSS